MLSQMIFTYTAKAHVTLDDKIKVAAYSVATSRELGLTGRVLVAPDLAINVIEGPKDILAAYVEAVKKDALIDLVIMHDSRPTETHEFDDYSVWLTYMTDAPIDGLYRLTRDNFEAALPKNLPFKTRLFIEANITIDA